MTTFIRLLLISMVLTPGILNAKTGTGWIELRDKNYSVFYQSGFRHDARFAQHWMAQAEVLMKQKYRVTPDGYHINVYLYPSPTDKANVGKALNECSDEGRHGIKRGEIYYLAPSSPAWKSTTHTTSHWEVQDSQRTGWRYYSAPEWFTQGLQEFDAIFHTTKFNATVTRQKCLQKAL